jgi:hypothetical protein
MEQVEIADQVDDEDYEGDEDQASGLRAQHPGGGCFTGLILGLRVHFERF